MSRLSLSSPILSSPLDPCTSSYSQHSIRLLDLRCHGFLGSLTCSKHHINLTIPCFRLQHLCRKRVLVNAVDESSLGPDVKDDGSVQATVEQGKRILALQKDLLDQIAERKKLVTALKENLGQAGEQVEAYNTCNRESKDSPFLELQLQQESFDSKGLTPSVARSSEKPTSLNGPVSLFDAPYTGQKVQGLDAKSPSKAQPSNSRTATRPPSFSGPFPSQSVSVPAKKNEVFQPSKQIKESASVQALREPAVTGAASSTDEGHPPLAGPNVMNVIIVAAECAPWSKTGGLGDVAGALPKALARRGHRVMVIAPRYSNYLETRDIGVRRRYHVAGQHMEVSYFHGFIDGVDHVFVDNGDFHGFANNIYGGNREDVLKRMVLFCKAAVEAPWHVPCGGVCYGDGNLVFIANDWHTALLPVYLQAYYRDNGLMQFARCILVIHNIAHQGRGPMSDYKFLGLPDHYMDKFRLYDPVGGEHMNVFMAGLITAHRIVAVSHGYAWECQTQLGGWGLDAVVREHNWKLRGIVNGIDDKEWNPELDVHLKSDGYVNFSLETLEAGKRSCKAALQKELGLPVRSDVPLLGFIGRLDHQKGVDIIADAMPWMMDQDIQLIMLGSGRDDLQNMLRSFEGQHRSKVRGWVGFSVKTAHRITAGCDILLMPSRFEPCGLNQLYAMKYGTVPVVHAVGGLRDTVQAFDPYSNSGTGWTFDSADASGLIHALGNAMWTFRDFKDTWRDLQKRCMSQDLSWDKAAQLYEEVMLAAKYQW